MRALVVGAAAKLGNEAFYVGLAAGHDLVVAADAAGEMLLAAGVRPDLVVGDFDSSAPGAADRLRSAGITVESHPERKDATDLDLAALAARARGATALTLTAAFAQRVDHTLAAFGTLLRCADLGAEAVEPDMHAWIADSAFRPSVELTVTEGTTVSLLAIAGRAEHVTLTGFEYPLTDATLDPLSGLGVSNVVLSAAPRVDVASGTVLVIASF